MEQDEARLALLIVVDRVESAKVTYVLLTGVLSVGQIQSQYLRLMIKSKVYLEIPFG